MHPHRIDTKVSSHPGLFGRLDLQWTLKHRRDTRGGWRGRGPNTRGQCAQPEVFGKAKGPALTLAIRGSYNDKNKQIGIWL